MTSLDPPMTPRKKTFSDPEALCVLPRAEHSISRKQIDEDSLKVLYRLSRHGHRAYLVGGGVRDLLLGRQPKDFDIGTDATPNQVKKLFRNCYLVGRRFRLAHIRFGKNKVTEVATFRRQARPEDLPDNPEEHFLIAENVFGTPCEDAFRRDFTINGLFYDIETFSIIDYVGGLKDLEEKRLRVIGDPLERFTEDPVRMLRALEFSARLKFSLEDSAKEGILEKASLIASAAPARIREELMELFRHKVSERVLRSARAYGLLPHLMAGFDGDEDTFRLLEELDRRTAEGTEIEEHFALAALYLSRFLAACPPDAQKTVGDAIAIGGKILTPHCTYFHVAHGIRHQARELLVGVFRLCRGPGQRGERRFLHHSRTPECLSLFRLWSRATDQHQELLPLWEEAVQTKEMAAAKKKEPSRKRPHRRRPPRRRGAPKPKSS